MFSAGNIVFVEMESSGFQQLYKPKEWDRSATLKSITKIKYNFTKNLSQGSNWL